MFVIFQVILLVSVCVLPIVSLFVTKENQDPKNQTLHINPNLIMTSIIPITKEMELKSQKNKRYFKNFDGFQIEVNDDGKIFLSKGEQRFSLKLTSMMTHFVFQ